MRNIKMVDLHSQYLKIKKEVDEAIQGVINKTAFIKGPDVKEFEKELAQYLDIPHVIACGNGTDALQVALMSLGLQPGDEVITSNFTFISTIEVIAVLGLTPVLVDVDPDTFNIDPGKIKEAVTDKTKAIIPVHIFGQCANMEEIMKIAGENGLFVIEDSAQAICADYTFTDGSRQKAGTIGDIGCTSFFPSKNLGCFGDGGAIYTADEQLAQQIRMIANHGTKVKYHHSTVGINSRLDTLQAAILRIKLRYLDQYTKARQQVADFYDRALSGLEKITIPYRDTKRTTHVFHQYTLLLNDIDREEFRDHLKEKGVPTMVYYPVPFHMQEAYKHLPYKEGDFPVTERICRQVVSLPMHTEMGKDDLQYITEEIINYLK